MQNIHITVVILYDKYILWFIESKYFKDVKINSHFEVGL